MAKSPEKPEEGKEEAAPAQAQQAQPVPEPDHYLEKPVDHDQLIQLVRDTIG